MLNLQLYRTIEKEQDVFFSLYFCHNFIVNMIFRQKRTFLISKSGKLAHF